MVRPGAEKGNVINHSFTDKQQGKITLSGSMNNGKMILSVHDDGAGIPEGMDFFPAPGFGRQVLAALSALLKGSIHLDRSHGTGFIPEFAA